MSAEPHRFTWKKFLMSPAGMILCCFLLIGGLFLVIQHRDHLGPYVPWLLLAACPLMHLFMHKHHKHNDDEDDTSGHARHHGNGGQNHGE